MVKHVERGFIQKMMTLKTGKVASGMDRSNTLPDFQKEGQVSV